MEPPARRVGAARPEIGHRQRELARDPRVLHHDGVGAAALEAEDRAPILQHLVLVAWNYHHQPLVRRILDVRAAEEMRRIGRARGIGPASADAPAVAVLRGDALLLGARGETAGRDEVARRAEDFLLRRRWEIRRDVERVARPQRETPADARIGGRDREHHAVIGREIELVTAVAPRNEEAIEAGVAKLVVQLARVITALLRRLGLGAHRRRQRLGARDHVLLREVRFGRAHDVILAASPFCVLRLLARTAFGLLAQDEDISLMPQISSSRARSAAYAARAIEGRSI